MINIIKGWFRFIFSKRSQMASDRLVICLECPFRKWYFCGECGCELHAKASLEEEECPKGKWPINKYDFTKGGYVPPSSIPFDNQHSSLGNYPYTK